jgi:hypothetical protein
LRCAICCGPHRIHEPLIGEDVFAAAEAILNARGTDISRRRGNASDAEITRGEQSLERYNKALEQGKLSPERCQGRLARLQTRLDDLHVQHAELSIATPHAGTSYYLASPVACATSEKVGREGIEPSTLGLRVPCSTS